MKASQILSLSLALSSLLPLPTRADSASIPTAPSREKIVAKTPMSAVLFPLDDVRLLDSPFKKAQETDRAYLLKLDPDRLLSYVRKNAGLTPKAPPYGGWDTDGAGTIGHYLSACANMVQATGDPVLKKRVDYIVSEMAACQQAGGDGGLYGFSWDKNTYFPSLAAGKVIPVNTSAWYLTHKLMAGLRDAYLLCGNTQARNVLVKMCDWADKVTAKLTPAQWQEMLGPPDKMGEFGGPHEVIADVYAITGDSKYLALAEKFRHDITFYPLRRGDGTVLNGRHANSEIPKFVSYERIYELTGDPAWHQASQNFWNDVTGERSWANGGDGQWEHFFDPADNGSTVNEDCGPETCATYNILKLTQQLYTLAPSTKYIDFYERALYNSILPSEAPDGGFVYYTSMRPGNYRRFSRPFDAFWCCVGTGMENHGKYGEVIYVHSADRLFVNLFIPSTLDWKAQGLTLRQETAFPEYPHTRLTLTLLKPRRLTLSVRRPGWAATGAFRVLINGKAVSVVPRPDSYLEIARVWKAGDRIDVTLPMRLRAETLPHSPGDTAFFFGPILLAGRLGTEGLTRDDFYGGGDNTDVHNQLADKAPLPLQKVPGFIGTPESAVARLRPVSDRPLTFTADGLTRPGKVTLVPFYKVFFERYAVYWPVQSREAYERAEKAVRELAARTVDRVEVGEEQSETDHHLASDRSGTGGAGDLFTHWRDAKGFFSYDVKVLPDAPVSLRCAYWGSDSDRTFDISVDGTVIATQSLTGSKPNEYLYAVYPVPPTLTRGKTQVTVRFIPKTGVAGGLFDLRVMRTR